MKLERELVAAGIVVRPVTARPVEGIVCSLNGSPFGFILTSNLIPQRAEFLITIIYVVRCRDIAEKLVRVGRQLGVGSKYSRQDSQQCKDFFFEIHNSGISCCLLQT